MMDIARGVGSTRKAMVFGVAAIIVAGVLLFMATSTLDTRHEQARTHLPLEGMQRLAPMHASLERIVAELILHNAGMRFTLTNATLTINEALSNPAVTSFRSKLTALASFTNARSAPLATSSLSNDPAVTLSPHNITYKHDDFGDDIRIVDADSAIDNYTFSLTTDDAVSCVWSFTAGALPVTFNAIGTNSSCAATNSINPTLGASVSVNGGNLTLTINATGARVASSMDVNLTMTLALDTGIGSGALAYEDTVINLTAAPVSQRSGVRLS